MSREIMEAVRSARREKVHLLGAADGRAHSRDACSPHTRRPRAPREVIDAGTWTETAELSSVSELIIPAEL